MSTETAAPAATMQACTQTAYGDARDALTFSTSHPAPPPPTAKQVQVRVHAASINPIDYKILHGNMKAIIKLQFPHVPGRDLAGVVTAVGSGVTRVKVGDAVMADNEQAGAYGETVNVPEDLISLKPDNITFAEAAALPLAATTALNGLEKASLAQGEKVVVIGGSGGTGSYAIQIAKILGASQVVAVVSDKNAEYVKGLGADSTVDYKSKKLSDALQKEYDVVVDCVGGKEQWDEAQKILNAKGRFVTYVGDDPTNKVSVGSVLSLGGAIAGRKLSGLFSSQHHQYIFHLNKPDAKVLDRIAAWAKEGKLKAHLDKKFEFSEQGVKELYAHSEAGRTVGKVVMEIIKEGEERAKQPPTASTTTTATSEPSSASSASSTDTTKPDPSSTSTAATTSAASESAPVTTADPSTSTITDAPATSTTSADSTSADTTTTTTIASSTSETTSSSSTTAPADASTHSTVSPVTVAAGGTGGSVEGTVAGDLPAATHSDVSTGSIE